MFRRISTTSPLGLHLLLPLLRRLRLRHLVVVVTWYNFRRIFTYYSTFASYDFLSLRRAKVDGTHVNKKLRNYSNILTYQ